MSVNKLKMLIKFMRGDVSKDDLKSWAEELKEEGGIDADLGGGTTCLHHCAQLGYEDHVSYLLQELNAKPDVRNEHGATPLDDASWKGHLRVVKLLVLATDSATGEVVNVDNQTNAGYTPLHRCAYYNHPQVASFLLLAGADPTLKDGDNSTPEDVAKKEGNEQLASILADPELLKQMYATNNPRHPKDRPEARAGLLGLCSMNELLEGIKQGKEEKEDEQTSDADVQDGTRDVESGNTEKTSRNGAKIDHDSQTTRSHEDSKGPKKRNREDEQ